MTGSLRRLKPGVCRRGGGRRFRSRAKEAAVHDSSRKRERWRRGVDVQLDSAFRSSGEILSWFLTSRNFHERRDVHGTINYIK